jgi:hypothetical protein
MRYTAGLRYFAVLLALAACCMAAEPAKVDTSTPIGQAFTRMYNLDFAGAHGILDHRIQQVPQDPLPYSVKAAAYLFSEMDRLQILQIEFFEDDDRVVTRKKLAPDPAVRAELFRLLEASRQRANARLSTHPEDRDSLFALCMASGIETDYAALIERRRLGSFILARQTQANVRRMSALTPPVYDAYLATGSTEYVVGSMPFYLRWFVRIDNITGSKQKGIETLQLVAERGRYYSPFARVLLAAIYMREKQFAEAERLLSGVVAEYPENLLIRKELQRAVEFRARAGPAGQVRGAAR